MSPLVRWLGRSAAGERAAAAVALVVLAWLGVYVVLDFPTWMATGLEIVAAATTLVMVFVIQHAQHRTEVAIQLKLDELVRSSAADNELIEIEHAEDRELERRRSPGSARRLR